MRRSRDRSSGSIPKAESASAIDALEHCSARWIRPTVRKCDKAQKGADSAPVESALVGADRKEAQVELGIDPVVPQALERVLEGAAQGLVLLAEHEADPLAEEAAIQIRAARQHAAIGQ